MAEVMHAVLAYYQAGRAEEAYRLLKANVLDFMYLGSSPGNFGQLSTMDRATGEGYRDFSDVTGISSRAFIEGLYGITPNALEGKCIIRPWFPRSMGQRVGAYALFGLLVQKTGRQGHLRYRAELRPSAADCDTSEYGWRKI